MSSPSLRSTSGFTLLEVILTLLIVSVVGVFVMQLFGSSFVGSTTPLTQLQNSFDLQEAMEEMTDDHNSGTTLADLQARITAKAYGDGSYTVAANDFVTFNEAKSCVAAPEGDNDLLLVTIRADSGETLTTLFSVQ